MVTHPQKWNWFPKYLAVLTSLFFVQIWPTVAGFTFRTEDLLLLLLLSLLCLWFLAVGRLTYHRSWFNGPLLLLMGVIVLGVFNTLWSPFDAEVKKDALVNGLRLMLAVSLFFVIYNYPVAVASKSKAVFYTIIGISFITTAVALLQIAHWNSWLPFTLPPLLTELKEGANTARGREIFALYIGNTGSHTWSGMLAVQAMVVWFWSFHIRNRLARITGITYFVLLVIILVRISVRNSILGLFIALTVTFVITAWHSRYALNRVVKPVFLVVGVVIAVALLFAMGTEYYFTQRILQTIPQFEGGQVVISRASNIYGRIDYIASAITIFKTYPVFGGGFYSYQTLSNALTGIDTVHAHNSYFQTLAELGLVGLLSLVWLIANIAFFLISTHRCLRINRQTAFLWQITTTYFIFLLYTGLFSNPFWSPVHMSIGMIFLGLLSAQIKELQAI